MNRYWERILALICDAMEPRRLVEIGVDRGALTEKMLAWATEHDAVVEAVDPHSAVDLEVWRERWGDTLSFYESRSLNVLGRIEPAEIIFIDGDHNWYTVINELRLIERTALSRDQVPPLVALHDVDWPYGRRDMYYDPESVPAAHRQPFERKGILPGQGELTDGGLNDHMNNAIYEHSIENGVRTAVEDFMAESTLDWQFVHVPGPSGLGILVTPERLGLHQRLGPLLKSFGTPGFLTALCEQLNRDSVHPLIKVAEQARALTGEHTRAEELGATVARLQQELQQLEELRATAQSAEAARQELEGQLSAARTALSHTQGQLEDVSQQRMTIIIERDQLAADRAELRNAAEQAAAELQRVSEERDRLAARQDALTTERDELAAGREALRAERDALFAERDRVGVEHDELVGQHRELITQRDALAEERDALTEELDALAGERDALAGRYDELSAAHDRLAAEREELAAERDALRADRDALTGERDALMGERDRVTDERDALAGERAALTDARDRLAAERDELSTARDLLSETQEALHRELEDAIRARDEAEAERARLDADIAGTLHARQGIRDQLAAEIERLEEQNARAIETEAQLRRQLMAADARAVEPDEQRRAEEARLLGASNGNAPVSNAATVWLELGAAVRSCEENISETISERDAGFNGDIPSYLAISSSAPQAIVPALALAGIGRPGTILDLPCGYGRVSRALRAAWPLAELVVADQSPAAVSFCAEHFGAEGWVVEDYLSLGEEWRRQESFDLIWSSALLTTLAPERVGAAITALTGMLRPGGVLVAAYHGRDSARRFSEHNDPELQAVGQAVAAHGVGFRARTDAPGLGTASYTPQWLVPYVTQERRLMLISVTERGWGDHLDVLAISNQDVHHRQKNLID